MKYFLQTILRLFSRLILWKYRPVVVVITGSVGKTSAKDATDAVLGSKYKVRSSSGNYNNEIGVPLTIIGSKSPGKNFLGWLWVFLKAKIYFFLPLPYPEVLVIEVGADRPGDLKYLMSFLKPNISVATTIGPSHLEFFGGIEKIIKEKRAVVEALSASGAAVLNYDDENVRAMADKNKGSTLFYSLENNENADLFCTDLAIKDNGQVFKLHHRDRVMPARLPASLGLPAVYAALAAAGVGVAMKINLLDIANALEKYQNPPGRLRVMGGVKNSTIIDDSYNSAPFSAMSALDLLARYRGTRKIAVLGDMAELGELTEEGHRQVGARAVDLGINYLVAVGLKAKFITDQARQMGYGDEQILEYDDSDSAKKPIEKIIQPGDVILIKGSQSMRMEKIVKEIMAEPWRAGELLCRQDPSWLKTG